jgi:hypothetical protein
MPPRRSAADNAFTVPPTAVTVAASCREPCLQDSGARIRRCLVRPLRWDPGPASGPVEVVHQFPAPAETALDELQLPPEQRVERMRHPHPTSDSRIGFTCSRRITPTL